MSERRLRISSGINLAGTPAADLREYMLRGIDFNAAAGFEALDFNTALWRYAPDNYREIMAEAKCKGVTGVEMEALTAVSATALTIYDMCKAVQKDMVIEDIRLLSKTGGKSGEWRRG